jgi:tRNA pseudouridine38-40 synthase
MSVPAGLPGGLTRFRINLAYDGTDFVGWAKQPKLRTVQGELLGALGTIFGSSENDYGMRVAGRTDAGVHAGFQVCHIDITEAQLNLLGRAPFSASRLDGLLPDDIAIIDISPAPAGFDARFSAVGRTYHFGVADLSCKPDPKQARYVLSVSKELDADLMTTAGKNLVGLRDFGAFCKPREGATTIRELRRLDVERETDGRILVTLSADAFCHNMVRSIVGALIAVGQGKLSVDELQEITKAAKRTSRFKVADPHGLSLDDVQYPPDDQLAAQAEKARNMRSDEDISV